MKSWLTGLGMAAVLVAGLLSQGCDGVNCTLAGCSDSLSIAFEPALEPGENYEFVVRPNDDEQTTITCTTLERHGAPSVACVTVSGTDLRAELVRQPDEDRIEGLRLWEAPESLELVIYRDRQELSRTTHRPSYETYYPNGEACDADWGGCRSAAIQVDL